MENETIQKNGIHQVATDLFYIRAMIVNVCFIGKPEQDGKGKTDWVLVDAGLANSKGQIQLGGSREINQTFSRIKSKHSDYRTRKTNKRYGTSSPTQ